MGTFKEKDYRSAPAAVRGLKKALRRVPALTPDQIRKAKKSVRDFQNAPTHNFHKVTEEEAMSRLRERAGRFASRYAYRKVFKVIARVGYPHEGEEGAALHVWDNGWFNCMAIVWKSEQSEGFVHVYADSRIW